MGAFKFSPGNCGTLPCKCGPGPCVGGCPACMTAFACPATTALMQYVNGQIGGGFITLTRTAPDSCVWTATHTCVSTPTRFDVLLDASGPTATLSLLFYSNVGCTTAVTCAFAPRVPSSSSCSGGVFFAAWNYTVANCPGLVAWGFTQFSVSFF